MDRRKIVRSIYIYKKLLQLLVAFLICYANNVFATLEITVLKQEDNALPIAVATFDAIDSTDGKYIAGIIGNDLQRSGKFIVTSSNPVVDLNHININKLKSRKVEALIFGKIEKVNENVFNIWVRLIDIYSAKELYFKNIKVHRSGIRRFAHQVADAIYYALLGEKGSFDTRLAYVTVEKKKNKKHEYRLEISDSDAQNQQVMNISLDPILSPAWSPDHSKIAYVSFANKRSQILIQHPFARRKTQILPHFDGIASSPSWHPNGESILLTLSRDGNKDIYSYHFQTGELTRFTTNSSIDTEASYSPDGKSIVFTSNRSGQVQTYIKNLANNTVERVVFKGSYNAEAVFSPDGKSLAMVHKVGKDYRIALVDIETKNLTVMTNNELDESPFFSPNGNSIIFSTNKNNKGVLLVVSTSGFQTYELFNKEGEVREPSWSNYIEYKK